MKIAYVTNMKLWRGPVKYYNLIDIQIYAAIYILKKNNNKKKQPDKLYHLDIFLLL